MHFQVPVQRQVRIRTDYQTHAQMCPFCGFEVAHPPVLDGIEVNQLP